MTAGSIKPATALTPISGPDAPASWAKTVPAALLTRVVTPLPESARQTALRRADGALADLVVIGLGPHPDLARIFAQMRWGGVAVIWSHSNRRLHALARRLPEAGFLVERGPARVQDGCLWPLGRGVHYVVARKVLLIPPGQITERFTYQVQLVHDDRVRDGLVVQKEVPPIESVLHRLQHKFPQAPTDVLERRARKFVDKIFPTFLTREAAILMILEEHLPAPYNQRVPRVISTEKDARGFVHTLRMTFLRNGGAPLSQMEFARQSADLLRAIHDIARVIHLDLRLDNFVITENGVGFVDFGSAVREGENLRADPLVGGLFEELMRTSQIQRMLYQMSMSGQLTSDIILQSHRKADKAIDFFYLAVQFNCPHSNPDLVDLIDYDPQSPDAQKLAKLTAEILRPADPGNPHFRSAKDILHGIERIQLKLDRR